jgi:hypothetical protein
MPLLVAGAALIPARSQAYVRTLSMPDMNGGQHYLWWPTREVPYKIQSDCAPLNPAAISAGEDAAAFGRLCRDAIARSFQSWQQAGTDAGQNPCSNMVLQPSGETSVREIGYDAKNPNESNLVLFQPQACAGVVGADDPCWSDDSCDGKYACFSGGPEVFAVTTTTYNKSSGMLLDADIEVNGAPPPDGHNLSAETGTPLPGTVDIQNVLTHESGHFIGLAHNCGGAVACTPELQEGTMFASASPGETVKRTLKPDDVAGYCHIYPLGEDTRAVNLSDSLGTDHLTVTAESCATTRGPLSALGLVLALLIASRRRDR